MVDIAIHEALARLERDQDFRVFMDEVRRRREAARSDFEVAADPWTAGRAQGASILAGELIELADKARSVIEKKRAR